MQIVQISQTISRQHGHATTCDCDRAKLQSSVLLRARAVDHYGRQLIEVKITSFVKTKASNEEQVRYSRGT